MACHYRCMGNPSCRFTGPQRYASNRSGNGEKKCQCGIWSLPLLSVPVPLSPDSSPFLLLHPFRWIVSGHFELRSRSLFSDNQITKFCNNQGCCLGRVILVTYYVTAFTCVMIHIGPSTHWLWFFLGKEVISPFMPTEQVSDCRLINIWTPCVSMVSLLFLYHRIKVPNQQIDVRPYMVLVCPQVRYPQVYALPSGLGYRYRYKYNFTG